MFSICFQLGQAKTKQASKLSSTSPVLACPSWKILKRCFFKQITFVLASIVF